MFLSLVLLIQIFLLQLPSIFLNKIDHFDSPKLINLTESQAILYYRIKSAKNVNNPYHLNLNFSQSINI